MGAPRGRSACRRLDWRSDDAGGRLLKTMADTGVPVLVFFAMDFPHEPRARTTGKSDHSPG
jgi:hypothetical protein